MGAVLSPPRDLVDEEHEEEVLVRGVLLLGESESLGQRRDQAAEPEALERGDQSVLMERALIGHRRPGRYRVPCTDDSARGERGRIGDAR